MSLSKIGCSVRGQLLQFFLLAIERSSPTINDHADSLEEVVRPIDVEEVMTEAYQPHFMRAQLIGLSTELSQKTRARYGEQCLISQESVNRRHTRPIAHLTIKVTTGIENSEHCVVLVRACGPEKARRFAAENHRHYGGEYWKAVEINPLRLAEKNTD